MNHGWESPVTDFVTQRVAPAQQHPHDVQHVRDAEPQALPRPAGWESAFGEMPWKLMSPSSRSGLRCSEIEADSQARPPTGTTWAGFFVVFVCLFSVLLPKFLVHLVQDRVWVWEYLTPEDSIVIDTVAELIPNHDSGTKNSALWKTQQPRLRYFQRSDCLFHFGKEVASTPNLRGDTMWLSQTWPPRLWSLGSWAQPQTH